MRKGNAMIIDKQFIESQVRGAYEQGDPVFDTCTEYPFTDADIAVIADRVSSDISMNDSIMDAIINIIDDATFSVLNGDAR